MKIAINKITLCVLLVQFCIVIPGLADVIPMQREEVIQRSGLIFVGAVVEKSARWNDKGNLIVTDYVFRVDDVLFGQHKEKAIKLTFAGGQLPEEGQAVSDVPEFQVGDVVLLMVEESATPLFSPVTGMYQGKFAAGKVPGVVKSIALDGQNQPMLTETGQALGFEELVNLVRTEIPVAKSKPLPDRSVPPELQKHVLKDLPVLPYDPRPSVQPRRVFVPQQPPVNDAQQPNPKGGGDDKSEEGGDQPFGPPATEWSYDHRAKDVPIVFNPWPDSFPGWALHHDQFAMSYWNDYADIYRVMEPTGTWAWRNDRYDMAGFPDNQTMIDEFGEGWGATTLAICWIRWDSTGFSIEADIACNPAYSWTTDDYDTYDNPNLWNLDRTLTHEVGHSWGLEHQFNFMSVMNYAPKKYRAYNVIYMDDSSAVRAAFPSEAVSLSDLDVALFYSVGFQDYDDSDLSTQNVSPGDSLTISNFVIENVGTVTMTPEIDWYLVPNINDWTGNRYLGSTTHSTLAQSSWFLTSRTLTIPSGIPDGTYYLGAFVSNSTDEHGSNDSSWLDRPIVVTVPPPNDNWAESIVVSAFPSTIFGNNVNATEEPDEQHLDPAAATVWWFFQARDTGTMTVDTFGSDFDTMLHIYSGFENGFPNLVLEAQNDDAGGGRQSEVSFPVVAGEFYEIRVAGYNGAEGNIVLNVGVPIGPTVVVPHSLVVTRGTHVSGGIFDITESDNSDVAIQRNLSDTQSRTEFEVFGTSPMATPGRLEVTLEGAVFARSTVVQTIELWDYPADTWVLVDTRNATNMVDSVAAVTVTSTDLSRFVNPTNLEVRARIHFQSVSARQRFASHSDQFIWTFQ